jgi:hypothetical protein
MSAIAGMERIFRLPTVNNCLFGETVNHALTAASGDQRTSASSAVRGDLVSALLKPPRQPHWATLTKLMSLAEGRTKTHKDTDNFT